MKSYRDAARLDSLQPLYPFAMGFLEQKRKNFRIAAAYYDRALDLDPHFEKALLQQHDLYLDIKHDEVKAMAFNDRLLEREPGHPLARYNLANHHYRNALRWEKQSSKQKQYQQAVNDAVESYTIAIHNGNEAFAPPYLYRALCYVKGKRYELALKDLEKAWKIAPQHPQVNFYLGSLYEYYENKKKALNHYKVALEYDPDFKEAGQAIRELSNP